MFLTAAQCRMARAALRWRRVDLAEKSKVSEATIKKFEDGYIIPKLTTMQLLRAPFEAAGVLFLEPRDGGFGVVLPNDELKVERP